MKTVITFSAGPYMYWGQMYDIEVTVAQRLKSRCEIRRTTFTLQISFSLLRILPQEWNTLWNKIEWKCCTCKHQYYLLSVSMLTSRFPDRSSSCRFCIPHSLMDGNLQMLLSQIVNLRRLWRRQMVHGISVNLLWPRLRTLRDLCQQACTSGTSVMLLLFNWSSSCKWNETFVCIVSAKLFRTCLVFTPRWWTFHERVNTDKRVLCVIVRKPFTATIVSCITIFSLLFQTIFSQDYKPAVSVKL